MSAAAALGQETLATVTTTFYPDSVLLEAQLRALPSACAKFLVDNASPPESWSQIVAIAKRVPNVRLLRNESNLGLAAAINRGVSAASELPTPPRFVLLLDQDTEPQPGSIAALVKAFRALDAMGEPVGCVGPLLRDPETGLTHGFHQRTRWRWTRVYPAAGSVSSVPCANLNGSGTLVPVSLFRQLGGLDESLFIDHVDTEWAFWVRACGATLWGVPNAVFAHRMGQSSVRFWWFGWRVWPLRSPQRHRFLYRNACMLMRRDYVPQVWKTWAVAKLAITALVSMLFGPARRQQLLHMARGVRQGCTKQPNGRMKRA